MELSAVCKEAAEGSRQGAQGSTSPPRGAEMGREGGGCWACSPAISMQPASGHLLVRVRSCVLLCRAFRASQHHGRRKGQQAGRWGEPGAGGGPASPALQICEKPAICWAPRASHQADVPPPRDSVPATASAPPHHRAQDSPSGRQGMTPTLVLGGGREPCAMCVPTTAPPLRSNKPSHPWGPDGAR